MKFENRRPLNEATRRRILSWPEVPQEQLASVLSRPGVAHDWCRTLVTGLVSHARHGAAGRVI
jgi:hypothetical protein